MNDERRSPLSMELPLGVVERATTAPPT